MEVKSEKQKVKSDKATPYANHTAFVIPRMTLPFRFVPDVKFVDSLPLSA